MAKSNADRRRILHDDEDGYLDLTQLANYAGVSRRTIDAYLNDPQRPLPRYRIGKKTFVRRSEFDAWMRIFASKLPAIVGALASLLL